MFVTGISIRGVLCPLGPPACLAALCLLAYLPFLGVPLFADSYIQIQLGRDFGPAGKWGDLFLDPLQRCRFTSIVVTHWTEQWFGIGSHVLRVSSLGLHILNTILVYTLGFWRPFGYRMSFAAACFFAIYQRPQEAVAWYAGLSDLLVFLFLLVASAIWIRFLEGGRWALLWYGLSFAAYVLALLSKESAVVFPLIGLGLALLVSPRRKEALQAVIPFAVVAAVYGMAAGFAREGHVLLRDGSVSLQAPAAAVLVRTAARLFWVWGLVAAGALAAWNRRAALPWLAATLAWIAVTALPYCFLTGQDRLSSRHSYTAAAGIAMLVGRASLELWERRRAHPAQVAVVASLCLLYQVGMMWAVRHPAIVLRARPTQELLGAVAGYTGPVRILCFPEGPVVAEHVLAIATEGHAWPAEKTPEAPARHFDGCAAPSGTAQAGGSGT